SFKMNEIQVSFGSGDLTLEGLLANPGANAPVAVVCHPHPLYGGSMYNNVVEAILAAMWQVGYATLRFNFRGVGGSEGEHDGGPGEVDDAVAAMAFVLAQPGVRKEGAVMAGYSFGAMAAMSAGYECAEIARIVAVALPLAMADARVPEGASRPVLLVSGDRDSYSPVAGLQALKSKIGGLARLEIVAGADHFFGGREAELSRVLAAALV
ncbi:MAG TPA: alpha/beta family hydrolase, partial [Candidatus Binatus sp.]|uniref:alpha/beta hydrolase n=1 Tax=Candidatus Binatus sp. TaxID=2811406 RepID=UPI002F3F4E06